MNLYEVVVRKIVTQAVTVEADSVESAKEKAQCVASDNDCEQILGVDSFTEIP